MVSSLINLNTKSWKTDQLIELFDEESIFAIQKITIPIRSRPDKLIWVNDPKGAFTVKSAYKTNQASTTAIPRENIWTKLWNLKVHDRIKMLLWRIGNNILPTKEVLAQRFAIQDTRCCLCEDPLESIIHLFTSCPVARAIWFGSCCNIRIDNMKVRSCEDLLKMVVDPASSPNQFSFIDKHLSHQISLHMALTLETIWSLRNQMIHNGDQVKLLSIIKNLDARVLEHMESLKASSQEQGDALNLNYQQNLSASVIPMQQGTTTWIPHHWSY